jgi:SAM-dependent methyltransferase
MYDSLAAVYEFLVPDALLEPEGAAEAFVPLLGELGPGARVLDCACGTGQLAVGLALRGFAVTATDASGAMIARTQALAARRGVALTAAVRSWEELSGGPFDAVLCVGNSLTHAAGRPARRAALAAMARVLRPGGLLAVTSRNWERLLALRPGLEVDERLVERDGRAALVVRAWTCPDDPQAEHTLEVVVALLGADATVERHGERLAFWPFTEPELRDDLTSAGLEPALSSWERAAERYVVTARRSPAGGAGGAPARSSA